jgi:hypothetical protein
MPARCVSISFWFLHGSPMPFQLLEALGFTIQGADGNDSIFDPIARLDMLRVFFGREGPR